jgi:Fur family ferric uptake transcriptional regulator
MATFMSKVIPHANTICKLVAYTTTYNYNTGMNFESEFKAALTAARERVTSPRLVVFRTLTRNGPISVSKLISLAKRDNIDKVTVYRTIGLLRRLELIQEVGLGRNRLLELSDAYHSHHHHFTCANCGKITDFDSAIIESDLKEIGERLGFTVHNHQVEMTGTCKKCAQKIVETA